MTGPGGMRLPPSLDEKQDIHIGQASSPIGAPVDLSNATSGATESVPSLPKTAADFVSPEPDMTDGP